jgi:hypothetical protein
VYCADQKQVQANMARSLMEVLLARKIEAASAGGNKFFPSRLYRSSSMESVSSIGSTCSLALGEDVCRCDDCLLGIVDRYVIGAEALKKGNQQVSWQLERL